jgi:hypothetical protein
MAAKNKMKYERNRLPGMRKLIDEMIDKSIAYILSDKYTPTMADMNRLIGYYLKIHPPKPGPRQKFVWVD